MTWNEVIARLNELKGCTFKNYNELRVEIIHAFYGYQFCGRNYVDINYGNTLRNGIIHAYVSHLNSPTVIIEYDYEELDGAIEDFTITKVYEWGKEVE